MDKNHDKVVAGLICGNDLSKIREAVCIHTDKIYDSCKEKDCIEDAKVFFRCPEKAQVIIDHAINVKVRRAEIVDVFADVEEVPFKRGFFTVDVKFFIRVTLDFFIPKATMGTRIVTLHGLVTFDKKVILFGSEGSVKIFSSHFVKHGIDDQVRTKLEGDNRPVAKVEVAEPIALNAKIVELCDSCCDCREEVFSKGLEEMFGESVDDVIEEGERSMHNSDKIVVVTLGLFSIVKLTRLVQLLIPAFDFCVPNKECLAATDNNPCELFDTIDFPVDEFFPPQIFDFFTDCNEPR